MRYRSDIDGLRTIAVLPIVLFHAGVARLQGGFVGVDVFFVISGFLITSIIFSEMNRNEFSVATFYRRRILRILPALFVMLFLVLLAGKVLLFRTEQHELAQNAAATAGFVSNLFLWSTADYFATTSESMPLLHTWSLGVEEQFYIFYPGLLWLVAKTAPSRVRAVLIAIVAGSFLFSAYLVATAPVAGFYLLPSRAWELGLGCLVALGAFPEVRSPRVRSAVAAFGLATIAFAYAVIDPGRPFPAPWALLPCVGTALIIAYGEETVVGRLLSLAPMRFVGRISYSLYLWHWPIITFYRLENGPVPSAAATLGLTLASFVMAILSHRLVEQPFLTKFRIAGSRQILTAGGAMLAVMISLPFLANHVGTDLLRVDPRIEEVSSYLRYKDRPDYKYQFRRGPCFRGSEGDGKPFEHDVCLPFAADRPNIVVVGDSHAAQYWRAIQLRYPQANVMQATAAGCRPTRPGRGAPGCRDVVDFVFDEALPSGRIDTLVIAGRWTPEDLPLLRQTADHVSGKARRVIVLGPTVEYQSDFPRIAAKMLRLRNPELPTHFLVSERRAADVRIAALLSGTGVEYVSVIEIECPGGKCRPFAPTGAPMQFDYGHLTLDGAKWVVDRMPNFLETADRTGGPTSAPLAPPPDARQM